MLTGKQEWETEALASLSFYVYHCYLRWHPLAYGDTSQDIQWMP